MCPIHQHLYTPVEGKGRGGEGRGGEGRGGEGRGGEGRGRGGEGRGGEGWPGSCIATHNQYQLPRKLTCCDTDQQFSEGENVCGKYVTIILILVIIIIYIFLFKIFLY